MSIKKKKTSFDPGMFYQAPVKVNGNTITIELPLTVAEYFGLDGPVVYWAPVSGVIQLSGKHPLMVIPMLCANAGQFVPQRAAGDAQEQPVPANVGNVQLARPRGGRVGVLLPRAPMTVPPAIVWQDDE